MWWLTCSFSFVVLERWMTCVDGFKRGRLFMYGFGATVRTGKRNGLVGASIGSVKLILIICGAAHKLQDCVGKGLRGRGYGG